MNFILEKIESTDSFDELCTLLKSKEMLNASTNFLRQQDIKINSRIFLSIFLIKLYPKDVLGTIGNMTEEGLMISTSESDDQLLNTAINIVTFIQDNIDILNESNNTNEPIKQELSQSLVSFKEMFLKWQSEDKNKLLESLIREYHLLTVNIMNAPESSKSILEECKSNLL